MNPILDAYVASMKEKNLPGEEVAQMVSGLPQDSAC
jgi:hypothetical protein